MPTVSSMIVYNKKGFTLIEILVAMLLVSMVTLVAAMVLKLAIRAWERGVEEGETKQVLTAIPALMEKQLSALVKNSLFGSSGKNRVLPFCGRKKAFSFFTCYAPQGSSWQGLLRVTYLFNEEESILYVYEQVITKKEDLKDEWNPVSDSWNKESAPLSRVPGIKSFRMAYTGRKKIDPGDPDHWKEEWECSSTSLPTGLRAVIQVGKGEKSQSSNWYFRVGTFGS